MLKKSLIGEFNFESENTRKLLKSIPDDVLLWKPSEKIWDIAHLATHIVGIYDLYDYLFNHDELDFNHYKYDKGDISKTSGILAKFEENIIKAKDVLENFDESKALDKWTMRVGEHIIIPPSPKVVVARNLLCNHLYHHRGELVAYLRTTGNKVPGLYGPTADDKK